MSELRNVDDLEIQDEANLVIDEFSLSAIKSMNIMQMNLRLRQWKDNGETKKDQGRMNKTYKPESFDGEKKSEAIRRTRVTISHRSTN